MTIANAVSYSHHLTNLVNPLLLACQLNSYAKSPWAATRGRDLKKERTMNKKLPPFGTAEYYSTIGKMGGNATKAKHGTKHFSEAGKKGFEATTQKYFGGDEAAHKEWLAKSGAYAYYLTSGLTMKYTADGKPVWPKPARHPSVNILLPF